MCRVIACSAYEQWASISANENVTSLSEEQWTHDKPDLHVLALNGRDAMLARCSLWWSEVPEHPSHTLSLIGHFEASSAESANAIIYEACRILSTKHSDFVVGPMDGSTWKSYRFVSDKGTLSPFFLEPVNPESYPEYFRQQGFSLFSEYSSSRCTIANEAHPLIKKRSVELHAKGVIFRTVCPEDIRRDLQRIYRLSLICFENNLLYMPISEETFLQQYRPLEVTLMPQALLLAERDEELVGYALNVPDLLQAASGSPVDTIILKTLACLPDPELRGLGSVLVNRCETFAREELHYRYTIHALMHCGSRSHTISNPDAQTIRRYGLFGRRLTS